jgi:hypothetical protein
MNMETINISITNGKLSVQRYIAKVAGAVRSTIRRPGEASSCNETKISRQARLEKERHQAQSLAQLQSTRYFR